MNATFPTFMADPDDRPDIRISDTGRVHLCLADLAVVFPTIEDAETAVDGWAHQLRLIQTGAA